MRRLGLLAAMSALAIATGALAQDEPEGKLWLRGAYAATYSWRATSLDSNKIGAVTTNNDRSEEMWDRITLIFTGNTTWKYRDRVAVEMQDNAMMTCSGGGVWRKITKHPAAINKGGEWAPYHHVVTEDGSWTYCVPAKPANPAMPPLMACGGSVVVTPPVGMHTLIFNPYPNTDGITVTGSCV